MPRVKSLRSHFRPDHLPKAEGAIKDDRPAKDVPTKTVHLGLEGEMVSIVDKVFKTTESSRKRACYRFWKSVERRTVQMQRMKFRSFYSLKFEEKSERDRETDKTSAKI